MCESVEQLSESDVHNYWLDVHVPCVKKIPPFFRVETPTERRVKRWAFGLGELLSDPAGLREFKLFLDKEFSSENISFWLSVETLKKLPNSRVEKKVRDIYE